MTKKSDFDALLGDIEAEAQAEGDGALQQMQSLTDYYSIFNQFIELGKKRAMTQKELAAASGINQIEISRIERARRIQRWQPWSAWRGAGWRAADRRRVATGSGREASGLHRRREGLSRLQNANILSWPRPSTPRFGAVISDDGVARELCYRLCVLCDRKKPSAEALSYNALVLSWPEISRLARESATAPAAQAMMFAGEPA
ncbi:MAG: helix-turn-helix domain-containing protein [Chloroflexota bacterium]